MLTVKGQVLGRKKPLFADWSIPIPPAARSDGGFTLRQLIDGVVREQVSAFRQRQEDNQVLRVLTARRIAAGQAAGKITSGESEVSPQKVNVEDAIGNALQAFEDGIYLVVVDEVQCKSLDAPLYLRDDSTVTFLRLTMLAGG